MMNVADVKIGDRVRVIVTCGVQGRVGTITEINGLLRACILVTLDGETTTRSYIPWMLEPEVMA